MLHLISVDTNEEADEISQRFNASGVPVFVEPDFTRTDPSARSAAFGYRIHIWLEEQLDDAKRLLRDPQYEVVAPVDVAKFYAALNQHDARSEKAWYRTEEKWFNWLVGIGAVGLIAWLAYAALAS